VFGLWYGKGPGVDRSGDVFKHANAAGTIAPWRRAAARRRRPCLQILDPAAPVRICLAWMPKIPVLNPSSVQEISEFGLIGWAMSRYAGCWVAMKTIGRDGRFLRHGRCRSGARRDRAADRFRDAARAGCISAGPTRRWTRNPADAVQAAAALAFARANPLDRDP
jgi:indolepyruvate ferredoxin oxidoreductase